MTASGAFAQTAGPLAGDAVLTAPTATMAKQATTDTSSDMDLQAQDGRDGGVHQGDPEAPVLPAEIPDPAADGEDAMELDAQDERDGEQAPN